MSVWRRVGKFDRRVAELADRHYSRQTRGARQFMPPGRTVILWHACGENGAAWGVCENLGPRGGRRARLTLFRKECACVASRLIRAALATTRLIWAWRYGEVLGILTTEVDPRCVRGPVPGYCFRRAGWRVVGRSERRSHRGPRIVFLAPPGTR